LVVGIKEKAAAARERDREARERDRQFFRRIGKAAQLQALGVAVPISQGELDPSVTEEVLDGMLAAEQRRRSNLYEQFVRVGTVTIFRDLGVQVLAGDDMVYTIGKHDHFAKANDSRLLGALAGAEATVTDGTSAFSLGKALVMPAATAALARKETADALIVFADGTVHSAGLDGSRAVRDARKQSVEFNALAGAPGLSVTDDGSTDTAARLRKLQDLLAAGLLSQEEYDAKRAQVIESI
jgi:Short C-terminal domain